ncbi:tRNA/rRNA methyltransferase [Sinobacterium caligoides]|uniref:tRNA (cytidine/uridine-2'-O-)-methyltransferase TrmJ n=1 Tax=Sinobacterium caligoides TaxID=933926 RepID=A0A3N2DQI7_9GAMM|nr:tRNA/rRNA methyltransferase [Sinobacterium caligoides]ROS01869.1 tRNA/rRNA methyltransferase [Sinobacterium caligoides]
MEIVFILSHPAVAENVGASARALKTMGFSQLRLVNSDVHTDKQARILAHGSTELLRQAKVFPLLADAVADCDLVIGTSAKPRHHRETLYPPSQLKQLITEQAAGIRRLAIVFGCEKSGLSNQELKCCDLLTAIPLAASYPSLNLSQAVMLYAYELSDNQLPLANTSSEQAGTEASLHKLQDKMMANFHHHNITRKDKVYQWALEKSAGLSNRELGFLHFICDKIAANDVD